MTQYNFVLSEENREKLLQEGLHFSVKGDARNDLKDKPVFFTEYSTFYNAIILIGNTMPLTIGAYSYSWNSLPADIKIGNYSSIAGGFSIMGAAHPYRAFTTSLLGYDTQALFLNTNVKLQKNSNNLCKDWKRILRIGNDVWCGGGVTISPKITISTGAVLAANALVTKDVPPYAIVGGNPAKIIKYRFEEKIIEKLLETGWTEYDIAPMEIRGDIPVENFIEEFYNYRDKGLIKPIVLKNLKEVLDKHGIVYERV
ncbi:MAG: CatB-related O-acetyltransferase [Neisseriaceae bacterium]|nr:CatB-related O-acetyltransferase [Neisseriaceae bacterium]